MQPLPLKYHYLYPQDRRTRAFHHYATAANQITLPLLAAAVAPVLVIWILFSTPNSRRQHVFWLQTLAIFLAITSPLLHLAAPRVKNGSTSYAIAMADMALGWFALLATDAALACHLLAFYPSQLASRQKRTIIISFPAAGTLLRVIAIGQMLQYEGTGAAFRRTAWEVTECALQVADNTYVSAIILLRIYRKFYAKSICASHTRSAFSRRAARLLLETFTMSFAPAVVLQTAALSFKVKRLLAVPLSGTWRSDQAREIQISQANVYLSLYFSLLATSWSAICRTSAELKITSIAQSQLRYAAIRQDTLREPCAFAGAKSTRMSQFGKVKFQLDEEEDEFVTKRDAEGSKDTEGVAKSTASIPDCRIEAMAGDSWHHHRQMYGDTGCTPDDYTFLHHIAVDSELDDHAAGFYSVSGEGA